MKLTTAQHSSLGQTNVHIATATGVDKGGPAPPMAGQEFFFGKTEGLLEPVVLNLSFRVRSNAMFTSERRY